MVVLSIYNVNRIQLFHCFHIGYKSHLFYNNVTVICGHGIWKQLLSTVRFLCVHVLTVLKPTVDVVF